jgi:hypothetical protein
MRIIKSVLQAAFNLLWRATRIPPGTANYEGRDLVAYDEGREAAVTGAKNGYHPDSREYAIWEEGRRDRERQELTA